MRLTYVRTFLSRAGQGEGEVARLSRHKTGRLISIKNIAKWRESTEVSTQTKISPERK